MAAHQRATDPDSRATISCRPGDTSCAAAGNNDDSPITTQMFPSNWELSAAGATNIVRQFVDSDLPAHRLQAVAFGDTKPKVPNRDIAGAPIAENQAINRRIVIRIHR